MMQKIKNFTSPTSETFFNKYSSVESPSFMSICQKENNDAKKQNIEEMNDPVKPVWSW